VIERGRDGPLLDFAYSTAGFPPLPDYRARDKVAETAMLSLLRSPFVPCRRSCSRRYSGFVYARLLAFMLAYGALLLVVSYEYLFPAMEAFVRPSTTPQQKKLLAAHAMLLLALMLLVLVMGLVLSLRLSRVFFPLRRHRAKPTHYPDAWEESARRIKVDPEDGLE